MRIKVTDKESDTEMVLKNTVKVSVYWLQNNRKQTSEVENPSS